MVPPPSLRLALLFPLVASGWAATDPGPLQIFPAVEPAAAVGTFRVKAGFTMELLAAEPLVASPVALAYDENGAAYVAEMRDYPYTDKATHRPWQENTTDVPLGRIRRLVDDDGDGRFDRGEIFAEGLSWPTGIACWRGGIFVTATPDLWYLKDTDGDGRADVRIKLYTGFRKFNIQTAVNNPVWGLDNRITLAVSGNGGTLTQPGRPDAPPVRLGGRDLRLDPRDFSVELIAGGTARFGHTYDDRGNRFLCSANNPAYHVVHDGTLAARNPYVTGPNPVYDVRGAGSVLPVHRISPLEPWRVIQAGRWRAAQATTGRKEVTPGGTVTSAAGLTIYRGTAYPPEFRGQAFVGEVANNVVHRQTVAADGVTFRFAAADADAEFVASTDTWFRPVNFVNAPDGTLHIVDMYRETVEHPWSVPDDLHARLDLTSGRDRGRLYRLAPPGFKPPAPPRLGSAPTAALVATLERGDAWWRETAQRLLFERQDPAAIGPLRTLLVRGGSELARIHALWTLDGQSALNERDLRQALRDSAAAVREHAVRLAALRFPRSPGLRAAVRGLAADAAVRVRYQVAFALAGWNDELSTTALLGLLERDADDRWVRAAALGTSAEQGTRLAEQVLRAPERWGGAGARDVVRQLVFAAGARHRPADLARIGEAFSRGPRPPWLEDLFWAALGDGLRQGGRSLRDAFTGAAAPFAPQAAAMLDLAAAQAREGRDTVARTAAVRRLTYDDFDRAAAVLGPLLASARDQTVQVAAVRALGAFSDPAVSRSLLAAWPGLAPDARNETLAVLLARRERTADLLTALEQGVIDPNQLPAPRRTQLLAHPDAALKARAARALGEGGLVPRAAALEKYRTVSSVPGDPARGQAIYERACAACHRLGGRGVALGPDLETVRGWDREKILLHIIDPNREVAPGYQVATVELRDGSSLAGMVSEDSRDAVRLRRLGAPDEVILRQNIVRVVASPASLMPEGLEAALSVGDMADLLARLAAP